MRNAKKTLSLVMVAIFTTFIVLSGIPAGAVTTAQAKAQVTKATAAVVKVEKTVKVTTFNVTTAQTQLNAAAKEVAKVKNLGKTYTVTYKKLVARDAVVAKKIAARKAAIAKIAATLAKLNKDAEAAVAAAEKATDGDEVDLVGDATALANAQGTVTAALELIVKLDKATASYKGLMARIDAANNLIVKAMDEIAAAEEAARLAAEAEAAEKAAVEAAEKAVAAVETAPLATAADLTAAVELGKTAVTAVAAVTDTEKAAAFTARLKVMADKGVALEAKLAADAEALKPATLVTVSAIDGTVTVSLNKKPLTTPAAADFKVTKSVDKGTPVAVTPTSVTVTSDTTIALAVGEVAGTPADQSVVYSVAYGTGTPVAAVAYLVKGLPALAATATATNLREINVVFNQPVDVDTAETTTNYTIAGATVSAATLQADGKTVLLETSTLLQQTAYTISVAGVKAVATGLYPTLSVGFTSLDIAVPTVVSATITGPTTLVVTFSEPVNPNYYGSYKIDNNTYSTGTPVAVSGDTHSVTVPLGTALPEGDHTVTVSGTKDYNSFSVVSTTTAFKYAKDLTLPTVKITSISQNKVELTFSKAITDATKPYISVYHTYNFNNTYKAVKMTWSSSTVAVVDFAAYLPLGTATVYVNNNSISATETTSVAKDAWANVFASTSLTGTVVADLTAPTVASVKAISNHQIDVAYSKTVAGAATIGNYTLKNSSGTTIALTNIVQDTTDTKIYHLYFAAQNGGNFTLAIANIKDTAIAQNALVAYSTTVAVPDSIAPSVYTVTYSSDKVKLFVNFTEAMATTGAYSIIDINKYQILFDGATVTELSDISGATIVAGTDSKSVIITFPAERTFAASAYVNVARVADLAGNVTTLLANTKSITAATIDIANIDPDTIMVVAQNKVQFDVDTVLAGIDVTKFLVAGTVPTSAIYVNNGTSSTVTLTTATNVYTTNVAGSLNKLVSVAPAALTDVNGIKNASIQFTVDASNDCVAPYIVSRTIDAASKTVTVKFSEALYRVSVAYDAFTVAGHTVSNLAFSGDDTLVITLGEAVTATELPAVQLVKSVMDATNHNVLAAETVGESATLATVTVDRAALATIIAAATSNLNATTVGTAVGNVPAAAAAALTAAIATATTEYNNVASTTLTVAAAVNALNAAVNTFNAAKIPVVVPVGFSTIVKSCTVYAVMPTIAGVAKVQLNDATNTTATIVVGTKTLAYNASTGFYEGNIGGTNVGTSYNVTVTIGANSYTGTVAAVAVN